jgi:UDP-glucose/GDP-mannose dehydrogenase family, NAD binding domain
LRSFFARTEIDGPKSIDARVTHKHPCDWELHDALATPPSSRETGRLHPAVALAHQHRSQEYKRPNLGPLVSASETVGKVLKKGDVVIYESTVYPGCTEDVCVPILERESGLTFNRDFFAAYSPKRINPGDKTSSRLFSTGWGSIRRKY